jgi:HEPN domain-containing protein
MRGRALDWLNQAKNDYNWAYEGISLGYYSQVCFMAQQAGGKAIRSIAYFQGKDVRGHSITKIAQALAYNGEIEQAGKMLDLFYISARYPDALPAGAPFEFFTKEQAEEALEKANLIIMKAMVEIEDL